MPKLNHFGLYHDRTKPLTSYYSPTLFLPLTNSVNSARKPVTAYNTSEFLYDSTRTDRKSLTTAPTTKLRTYPGAYTSYAFNMTISLGACLGAYASYAFSMTISSITNLGTCLGAYTRHAFSTSLGVYTSYNLSTIISFYFS